jgi:hypothetical protein
MIKLIVLVVILLFFLGVLGCTAALMLANRMLSSDSESPAEPQRVSVYPMFLTIPVEERRAVAA